MTLGVYIQIPFCRMKCTYCNFHTGVYSIGLYEPYVNAVCRELSEHASLYAAAELELPACEATVDTVYVGGGTPSLLAPTSLSRILENVRGSFLCQLGEVTLEADPETVTHEKAAAWLAAGFNRISLGAQSFDDTELRAVGRLHRREDIFAATRILREAGLHNLSFDLIAGLPHQTARTWEASLDNLLELRPEHCSIYLLEIDEGSRLGREALAGGRRYSAGELPGDDAMASFYETACERLATAGYEHYEISNWALPGFRSCHNLKYWRRELYLGFGAGAHSFNGFERWANVHHPARYGAAIERGSLPLEQREAITPQMALDEELFLGMRRLEGIELDRIEQQYNLPAVCGLRPRLEELRRLGLVEFYGARVRLAPERLAISNEALVELLS